MPWFDVITHESRVERYRLEADSEEAAKAIVSAITVTVDPTPDEIWEMDQIDREWYISEVTELREPPNE
jgi:hypothetical protein